MALYSIANAPGATVRSNLNTILGKLHRCYYGATDPATGSDNTSGMWWIDTNPSNPTIKIRNAADTGWITVGEFDGSSFYLSGSTTFGRSLIDDANAAAGRGTLGLTEAVVTTVLASQAEAEGGTENTKLMTPLRVAQAITELSTGAYTLLERITANNQATVDLTAFDNTKWTKGYVVRITKSRPATDGSNMRAKISTDGGSTWLGGTDYDWWAGFSGNSSSQQTTVNDQAHWNITWGNSGTNEPGSNIDEGITQDIRLHNFHASGSRSYIQGWGIWHTTTGNLFQARNAGRKDTAQENDAIQFYFEAGNVQDGVYELFGVDPT